MLVQDSAFKLAVAEYGKIDLDKFDYRIIPVLKWNSKAKDYRMGDNICSMFDLDTVYYTCEAGLFLDTTLYFYCSMGNIRCTIFPGISRSDLPEFYFKAIFFQKSKIDSMTKYYMKFYSLMKYLLVYDSQLRFQVDGLWGVEYFVISNGSIRVYHYRFVSSDKRTKPIIECPDEYICKYETEKWIRYCAWECPCYKYHGGIFGNGEYFILDHRKLER